MASHPLPNRSLSILHILDHSLPAHSGYTFRTRAILDAQRRRGWHVEGVTSVRQPAGPAWTVPGADAAAGTGAGAGAGGRVADSRGPRRHAPVTDHVDGLTFHRTAPITTLARALPGLREWAEVDALADRIVARVMDAALPRIDILHAHSPLLCGAAALLARRRTGLPVVYEIRAFWEDAAVGNGTGREGDLRYRLTARAETAVAARADHVVTICDGLRRDLIGRGIAADRISVMPNGVDLAQFGTPGARDDALARRLGLPDGAPVIGFIGSFYPYEGLDLLIDAAPAIIAAVPDARLLIVGGGPDEAALRAAAAASPVADRILFVGRVPQSQVDLYYGLIDILAYPRRAMRLTETVTPLKPLEAMAQRRLVIASDVGGHRELMTDGDTACLFAPDDPAALAAAATALIADRAGWDRRRDAARAMVDKDRNWSSNIARYAPVYDMVMRRHAVPVTAESSGPTR